MKFAGKTVQKFAVLAAVLSATFLSGCATLDQNMAASRKEHLIPGKEIAIKENFRPHRFCEIGLITGTSKANAVANIYNTTSAGDCSEAQFAALNADKLAKETGSRKVWLNPTRWWMMDEFYVYEVGDVRSFGDVKAVWMGVVGTEAMMKATVEGFFFAGRIFRNNKYVYQKGKKVYLLDTADGQTFVMQSYTNFLNKSETVDSLDDLGSKLTLPAGWKYRVKVLDKDLEVHAPAPGFLALLLQDNFRNTYQGCDSGAACSYIP